MGSDMLKQVDNLVASLLAKKNASREEVGAAGQSSAF
jgi:hypothetical protein